MPETRGKCTNSTVCSLAQEGQIVTTAGDLVCPECGGRLQPVAAGNGAALSRATVAAVWIVIALLGVGLGWKLSRMSNAPQPSHETAGATAAQPASPDVTDTQRQEVLKRIDLMPNVTAANKERLYFYVERAQRIKRIMSVSFQNGGTRLSETAVQKVVEESKKADFAAEARDPVMVFVVLGFADKKGDDKINFQTSHDRAEHVADLLRKRCGVTNVIQTVPMGSSELFNVQSPTENRVVEVWAVLP